MNAYIHLPGVAKTLHRKFHKPALTNWPRHEYQSYLTRPLKTTGEQSPEPKVRHAGGLVALLRGASRPMRTALLVITTVALFSGPVMAQTIDEVVSYGAPLLSRDQLQMLIARLTSRRAAKPAATQASAAFVTPVTITAETLMLTQKRQSAANNAPVPSNSPAAPSSAGSSGGGSSAGGASAANTTPTEAPDGSTTPVPAATDAEKLGIRFTAVDGREVDLASLRGKVVLIDFWATWCGPCMGEIPHVVDAYNKYHEQGFEVIGISFDTSRTALQNVTRAKNMPWPQYFDGKGWRNDYGVKFGIHSIPTMWLIDQEGNIVTKNARNDLAGQVAKLLAAGAK